MRGEKNLSARTTLPPDVLLKIVPGAGNLTKKLLVAGKSVLAVELDPRMVLELQRRF